MTSTTDIKLQVLNIGTSLIKRIPVPQSYSALKEQAQMLVQGRPVKITYKDNDGDFVDVADDCDLNFALQ